MARSLDNLRFDAFLSRKARTYTGTYSEPMEVGWKSAIYSIDNGIHNSSISGQHTPTIKIDFPYRVGISSIEMEIKSNAMCSQFDTTTPVVSFGWSVFDCKTRVYSTNSDDSSREVSSVNNLAATTRSSRINGYTILRSKITSNLMIDTLFLSITADIRPYGTTTEDCSYTMTSIKIY
jgi:hypothetical protein